MTLRTRAHSWVARLLTLVVLAASAVVLGTSAANADVYPCRRAGGEYRSQCAKVTDVNGALPLQLGAGYGNTRPGTAYHNGDELALACWTTGPADEYGNGDPYWLQVFDVNDTSVLGFVNDYNLTTGPPGDWTKHLSHCDDPVSQTGKPYQCDRQGGEYRAWCANATYVAEDMWLPLDKHANYADGAVSETRYHNGDPLALACWTTGPGDFAGHGDRYWFNVYDPNDHSIEGYVNDYQLTTGSPADWKKVVGKCGHDQPPPVSYPHSVKVLQWNIAGIARAGGTPIPLQRLANVIQDRRPQIVSLNEICASQAGTLYWRLRAVGINMRGRVFQRTHQYGFPWYQCGTPSDKPGQENASWAGNELMSLEPISHVSKTYFKDTGDRSQIAKSGVHERGIVCADIGLAAPVRACSAHLNSVHSIGPKQAQTFANERRSELGGQPSIIVGDFNSEPRDFAKYGAYSYVPGTARTEFYDVDKLRTDPTYSKGGPGERLDYIFSAVRHFAPPKDGDAAIISPGSCPIPLPPAGACSDHSMLAGTLHYHE